MTKMKKFKCKNFIKGYIPCELCVINKEYIDFQNANMVSCFEPLLELEK